MVQLTKEESRAITLAKSNMHVWCNIYPCCYKEIYRLFAISGILL